MYFFVFVEKYFILFCIIFVNKYKIKRYSILVMIYVFDFIMGDFKKILCMKENLLERKRIYNFIIL